MNRFRTKKKNKEEAAATAAAAAAAASAASFTRASTEENHSFMGFRRNKKAPEEVKEEIDLSSALPATDDFRTSLLMTGLSARFSMLREQDDPNTKIGKALDDSVLFPSGSTSAAAKRQSRMMMDFGGFRGLDDIAEVESIRGMRPPPFMRTHSFASDTDSLGDSIMNRTRPTDGNNLFGGRQKIYRIPAGAVSSKSLAEGGMGGRALYDDDVALSEFQKLRQEKKDQFLQYGYTSDEGASANVNSLLLSADSYEATSPYTRSESPSPIDYNLRRETSSTTSSGGARNSTAATSVVSQSGGLASSLGKDWQSPSLTQSSLSNTSLAEGRSEKNEKNDGTHVPVERTTTMRIRRLYEQGLNQDMHEQQNSALSRIDTLSGKRMLRSKTPDLNASASPSPTPSFGFKDSLSNSNSTNNSPSMGTVTSTLERLERRQALAKSSSTNLRSISPPMSGSSIGSPLPGTISARTSSEGLSGLNMVGLGLNRKTSAAGSIAGSGPTNPPLSPPISESGVSSSVRGSGEIPGSFPLPLMAIQPNDMGKATAMGMFQKPTLPYDESRFAQRQLQLQQGRETPTESVRSDSKLQQSFLFDGDDDDESNYDDNESQRSGKSGKSVKSSSTQQDAVRPQVVLQRPSDADHPAFRQQTSPAIIPEEPEIPTTMVTADEPSSDANMSSGEPVDSPTLGPGGGLSGMVLQHLRSTSNASSVYSMVSPQNSGFEGVTHTNHLNFDFGDSVAGSRSNTDHLDLKLSHPWDDSNNWTASIYSSISTSESYLSSDKKIEAPLPPLPSAPPPPVPSTTAASTPTQAPPTPRAPAAAVPTEPTRRAPSLRSVSSRSRVTNSIADSNRSSAHTDNIPGENEEDDFASQLASARRRVQERLTTYAESESSRSNSPQLLASEPSPMMSSFQHLPSLSHNQSQSQTHPQAPPTSSIKSNPLGILRAKSSRGSLLDRTRDAAPSAPPVPSPSLPKMLGLGASTMSTAPSPSKQSFEQSSFGEPSAPPAVESAPVHNVQTSFSSAPRSSTSTEAEYADDDEADRSASANGSVSESSNAMHPGLLAFRNARRQLQKRKEIETLGRHGDAERSSSATPPPMPGAMSSSPAHSRSPPRQRRPTVSAKQPPPLSYQQRDPSLESRDGRSSSNGMRSRSGSRTGADMRDRSGSEASNNGFSRHAPPPRIRTTNPANGQSRYDERSQPSSPITSSGPGPSANPSHNPNHLGALPARPGMMPGRSPGLPGTDIRRSPHMPPQGYPNGSGNSNNLSVQTAMGGRSPSGGNGFNGSAQPSPISPLGSAGLPPFFPGGSNGDRSGPPTPTGIPRMMQQQRPGAPSYSTTSSSLNESMKRTVRKNEISEPTFVMSTSRVPTMSLAPQQQPGLSQSTSAPEMDGANGGSTSGSRARSNSRAAHPGPLAASSTFVPPLPPINPLRKQSGSRGPRGMLNGFRRTNTNDSNGDEMDTMSALKMPSLNVSASTSNLHGSGGGDTEDRRPALRKQASEASGMHSRLNQQRMDLPGGMI
ncbi:hypothetical protein F503_04187 [Ophiostoma piceae UAMH 11346]|uniref:Glycosyl hydrolase family 43 protein n=1 Tax=Ophiostoma piceae (strain UAMH 11346) TaxID=1262450 RepID=S3D5B1_OPHP1|nr:hypothetical protein F503_04187 [Ophiostoma piceae UAMH 11346]